MKMDYSAADKVEVRLPELKHQTGEKVYTILDAREKVSPKGGNFWFVKLELDGNRYSHTFWPDLRYGKYHWVELKRFLAAVAKESVDKVNAKMIAQAFSSGLPESEPSPLAGRKVCAKIYMKPDKNDASKEYPTVEFLPA